VRVVEDFSMDRPSTRELTDLLDLLELEDQKVLVATTEVETEIYRSAQNLPNVNVREVQSVNTVDILDADAVVFQEGALEWITDVLSTAEPTPA
jgi:large subunit ribosomal protein L4